MFPRYNTNTVYHHVILNVTYKKIYRQNPNIGIRELFLLSEDLEKTIHLKKDLAEFYTND